MEGEFSIAKLQEIPRRKWPGRLSSSFKERWRLFVERHAELIDSYPQNTFSLACLPEYELKGVQPFVEHRTFASAAVG